MRYVKAKVNIQTKDMAYRIYVTDSLKMIAENTAKYVNGGKYLNVRYIDVVENKPTEERTGDEIITGIREKLHKLG